MDFAGIKVPDTALVRDAMDLSRSLLEPFLFNHVMRSWLFAIVLAERTAIAPDAVRIGKNRPRAGKQKLRNIRAGLHNLELDRFTDGGRTADIRNLRGQITFV